MSPESTGSTVPLTLTEVPCGTMPSKSVEDVTCAGVAGLYGSVMLPVLLLKLLSVSLKLTLTV